MLSLEEISDRLELQHLLISYSEAIDRREFDELDEIFVDDAYIDYRDTGGIDGRYPQIKVWLAETLPAYFERNAHMLGCPPSSSPGHRDRAHLLFQPDGAQGRQTQVMQVGVWYDDEFVRTADGWRLSRRVEIKCYDKIL